MNGATTTLRLAPLLSYSMFALPLALVALPLYVSVPALYAERFGLSLTSIGAALLLARLLDAFTDPMIGAWVDRSKTPRGYGRAIAWALPLLAGGFVALFSPPTSLAGSALAWFMVSLIVTYAGFSLATVAYQSWGAGLSGEASERTRVTAWREGCGLAGVLLAAACQQFFSSTWLIVAFVVCLLLGAWLLLQAAPAPAPAPAPASASASASRSDGASASASPPYASWSLPFNSTYFRWLFAAFMVNGIAAAIPATLFIFFTKDHLQLGHYSGAFLLVYFLGAAVSMPAWVVAARRLGETRAWLVGILFAILSFSGAFLLAPGEAAAFGLICVLSGFALGADLALPPALLAAVIRHAGHDGQHEGRYFGLWNWATKMNLALAAGLALPILERLGYRVGTIDSTTLGLSPLVLAYAVIPCCLKLGAALIVWRAPLRDCEL